MVLSESALANDAPEGNTHKVRECCRYAADDERFDSGSIPTLKHEAGFDGSNEEERRPVTRELTRKGFITMPGLKNSEMKGSNGSAPNKTNAAKVIAAARLGVAPIKANPYSS